VRGVVGDALTPELIANFACAFGTWCGAGPVVIGRDTRRSSAMLRASVLSGLLSTGCEVIDLGVCPTPLVSFAVRELGASGGLSITGSHNDARWNALKFIGPDGTLLNAVKSEELLDIYHATAFLTASWDRLQSVTDAPGMVDRYLENLLAALDVERIRERGFRVAMDFCNGACGALAVRFLAEIGCALLPVNEEPSGEFTHPPAPTVANMRQLAALMRSFQADIGAAINVDGDRIAFVTAEGVPLSEECTLPLAALNRLARRPGPVVTNLSTSRMIETVAQRHGQAVLRTMVGEGYVMDKGLSEGAVLAGEGCGAVGIIPATVSCDGLLTLGVILEQMAATGVSLAELADQLPRYVMRKHELACPTDLVYRALEGFRTRYAEWTPDCADGVRIDWPDGWLHVRASNTEPLMRIIAEGETAERADEIFEEAMGYARRVAFGHGQG
jgi:phosphomannomutase